MITENRAGGVRGTAPATSDQDAAAARAVGPAGARVALVVYGSYACLHCRRAYAMLDELSREMGAALRVAYRHFARPEDFPDAASAAAASAAAAAQGRFRAMHLRLTTAAPFFDDAALVAHAAALGLDAARFARDLASESLRAALRAEHAAAESAGVTGTPSFVLNGVPVQDRWDLDALGARVRREAGV
jgi:protein-disulfide isomerase